MLPQGLASLSVRYFCFISAFKPECSNFTFAHPENTLEIS